MRKRICDTKGMTLVEVTVTLVIVAILAAIMVPSMTGWLDRGREKSVIAACGTCVFVAQSLVNESVDEQGGGATAPAPGAVAELAGLSNKGSVSNIVADADSATLEMLTYTESASGISATYERRANPQYRIGQGVQRASQGQSFEALLKTYQDALTGTLKDSNGNALAAYMKKPTDKCRVDSVAIDNNNTNEPYAKAMLNALSAEEREFLKDKSWSIQNTSSGVRMFFTEKVYTKDDAGKTNIVIYKYDPAEDKYQRTTKGAVDKDGKIPGNTNDWTSGWTKTNEWYTWDEIQEKLAEQSQP